MVEFEMVEENLRAFDQESHLSYLTDYTKLEIKTQGF